MKKTVYKTLAYEAQGTVKLDTIEENEWTSVLHWSAAEHHLEEYVKATSRPERRKWAVSVEVVEFADGTFTIT